MPVEHFLVMGGHDDDEIGTDGYALRPVAPEPNPPFVFPARRNLSATGATSPATFSKRPVSSGHPNPLSTRRPKNISTGGLPAFDFHPGKSPSPVKSTETPPESPAPNLSVPPRGGGHRRGGSEFIGGDGEAGGPGLMSTSPTKREGALTVPTSTMISGPPAGRRGHSHRRSGAISSHDVALIRKPAEPRVSPHAGSAPNTPSEVEAQVSSEIADERAEGASTPPARHSPVLRNRRESAPASGQVRARVGFSDTLEFIPRPLSIVSLETSSSMSPTPGSHSVSDSITSLVSTGTASPPSAKPGRSPLARTFENRTWSARPKTAGAVMTGTVSDDPNVVEGKSAFMERPPSTSTSMSDLNVTESRSTRGDYRRGVLGIGDEATSSETSPSSPPVVGRMDRLSYRTHSPSAEVFDPSAAGAFSSARTKGSPERRAPRKQKQVKSWAGSILSRKGRHRSQKQKTVGRRTPTPPLRSYAAAGESDNLDVNFDEDPTFVISVPSAPRPSPAHLQTGFADWKPREPSSPTDTETMSPVIDLDAALGPFNTPSLGPQFRDALDRGFTVGKRAMHSSGATGGFVGPGMHYHRRAESAPEMVAFNVGHFGLHRLASSSTMADVFEEDEDEDEATTEIVNKGRLEDEGQADVEGLGIGVQVVDADDMSPTGAPSWSWQDNPENQRGIKRKGSGLSDRERRQLVSAVKQGTSTGSLNSEAIVEESSGVEIVPMHEELRISVVSKSSDESTITPSLSHGAFIQRPASAPTDLVWSVSDLQPTTPRTISSTFSSPGFTNSSFDGPRVATPASSFTDRRTLSSLFNGEPGPELRMSVDDVPSLTSSASTMTNIHPAGRFSSSAGTRSSAERSLSVSAAETPRARNFSTGKRSSLASLSRLVGGSYGERSKLFIEERAQPDNTAKPEKKKGNRISRLIHFWKSKEKLNLE